MIVLMNLRRTVADGSCDSEWRRYSIVGGAFDVKHLEAFDVHDHVVIIAFRHGGLEAMDLG